MSRILVTYATNSGSTGEVAQAVAEELNRAGQRTEVREIAAVNDLDGYDAVVVGAPMIFGWHTAARRFVRDHAAQLAQKKTAYFACAMRLTSVPDAQLPPVALTIDPNLAIPPHKPGSLGIKERFTTALHYLKPMLASAPGVQPRSVAFFNGKLEMYRLKWWQAAFVMVVVQGAPGDYRDWQFIRAWGRSLADALAD
ncbi:MAG: flavodoxin domain-containing protein [Chloroflexota bacterium]